MRSDYFSTKSSQYRSTQATQSAKNFVPSTNRTPKIIPTTIYSIPCMNCENLIPIGEIDLHTVKCQSVSKNLTAVLKSNKICDEINFKISKLRESIQQLNQKETKQENMKYLIRADEMCEQILTIQNNNQIEYRKLIDLNQELRTITESYRGSLAIALYLERLHSLGLQKQSQIEKEFKTPRVENQNIQQLQKINTSSTKSQLQIQDYQSENSKSSKFQQPQLLQFQSPILGRPTIITKFSGSQDRNQIFDMKSEILTKISTSQFDNSEDPNDSDLANSNQYNQQQRIFYSKCLAQKTKLPNTHPSQKIPLCILHKEVIQRKVPPQMWDKFISDALNNPHQYLDMNKVQNNQGLKNQLRSMTQEHHFKQRIHNIQ